MKNDFRLMNRALTLLILVLFCGSLSARVEAQPGKDSESGGRGEGRSTQAAPAARSMRGVRGYRGGAPVVIKMRRYTMPAPHVISNPEHIVRDRRQIQYPRHFEGGGSIVKQAAVTPPAHHTAIVRNTAIVNTIVKQQRVEVVRDRFYWHHSNGFRYAHYYDNYGVHWYGFYHGPAFYWTRYHAGYWWWWDVRFGRWVYWWDGYWWWPGPGLTYVYMDNSYYPYEDGVVTTKQPEVQPPPQAAPSEGEGASYNSPDHARMVQLVGSQGDGFLYDSSGGQPVFMKYLGTGVEKIRYSGGTGGRPVQILAEFKDGSFALFDANGNPQDPSSAPAAGEQRPAPPPAPEAVPPPPSSAPGESEGSNEPPPAPPAQ